MDEQSSPPNDVARLDAAIAELERELGRRREAKWLAGEWTIPIKIVDEGKTLSEWLAAYGEDATDPAQEEYPPEVMELHIINPDPQVEPPSAQWGQPDTQDVSPQPYRPPVPPSPQPSPPRSARSLPPPKGQPDPRNYNIPGDVAAAERRRTRNFNDDTWGDPTGWPIRYPRGNRSGW